VASGVRCKRTNGKQAVERREGNRDRVVSRLVVAHVVTHPQKSRSPYISVVHVVGMGLDVLYAHVSSAFFGRPGLRFLTSFKSSNR